MASCYPRRFLGAALLAVDGVVWGIVITGSPRAVAIVGSGMGRLYDRISLALQFQVLKLWFLKPPMWQWQFFRVSIMWVLAVARW